MAHQAEHETGASEAVGKAPSLDEARPPICPAARRWADMWKELDLSRAELLRQAPHVKADRFGLHLELVPQLFDLHGGRRYISIGVKYESGPGRRRPVDSPAFGQFLNLPFTDWTLADQLWDLLKTGDMGVSFQDLDVINGNFDKATKASDQFEKDKWIQRVWELKLLLEQKAQERTLAAVKRIAEEMRARQVTMQQLWGEGVTMAASVMEPDPSKEAVTRFRINQGLYGDHTYFVDRPVDGKIQVHGVPPANMFHRATELERALTQKWLGVIGLTLRELIELTADRQGATLARAIESADVIRKLNVIVSTFWDMWRNPIFSANAAFEVVTDHERRAAKYMDILIQRSLRILLKQAVEGIGLYPYSTIDRNNYWGKIYALHEALVRARRVLELYSHASSVPAFREAHLERERLVKEFQAQVLHGVSDPYAALMSNP